MNIYYVWRVFTQYYLIFHKVAFRGFCIGGLHIYIRLLSKSVCVYNYTDLYCTYRFFFCVYFILFKNVFILFYLLDLALIVVLSVQSSSSLYDAGVV